MTHRICESDVVEGLEYVQRVWRLLLSPELDSRTKLDRLLEHETDGFDLEYGLLSRVDVAGGIEHFEAAHGSHDILQPNATVPLSRTYCRKTITDPEGTLAVSDARAEGWEHDPAYEALGLGSYLGTTITADDELYGVLWFANPTPRDDPLTAAEKSLIELYGRGVEHVLAVGDDWSSREAGFDAIAQRAVSSEAIDSMMNALETSARRTVLAALCGDNTTVSITTLTQRVDGDADGVRLYHATLPTLADAGYISWNRDAGLVSAGPKFSEVEPLVQLLKEYTSTSAT